MIFKFNQILSYSGFPYYLRKLRAKVHRKDSRRNKRFTSTLPEGWDSITFETALNSRCISDFDEECGTNHYGTAYGNGLLSGEHFLEIDKVLHLPFMKSGIAKVERNGSAIHFFIDPAITGNQRYDAMIETGIKIQTVAISCAALGIAVTIKSYGSDGGLFKEKWMNLSFELFPMKPGFDGIHWTNNRPTGEREWKSGNMPDPDTQGKIKLFDILEMNRCSNIKNKIDKAIIGQLLWAARGRTPHYYLSKAWGLTIPTAYGIQNRSSIVFIDKEGVYKYINWKNGRPTHSLIKEDHNTSRYMALLTNRFPDKNAAIALLSSKTDGYALWEIGFMLQNLRLQAEALGISLDCELKKDEIESFGVDSTRVVIAL